MGARDRYAITRSRNIEAAPTGIVWMRIARGVRASISGGDEGGGGSMKKRRDRGAGVSRSMSAELNERATDGVPEFFEQRSEAEADRRKAGSWYSYEERSMDDRTTFFGPTSSSQAQRQLPQFIDYLESCAGTRPIANQ